MKPNLLRLFASTAIMALSANAYANERVAMMIADSNPDNLDFQEAAAYNYFKKLNANGTIIVPGETGKINAADLDCIWIHIDRCDIGKGKLPEQFANDGVITALKQFLADGGNLLLTKQATQLITRIGRISDTFEPNIYSDGNGGLGTDVWTIQAQIGYLWSVPTAPEYDMSQYYDRRGHDIYKGFQTMDFTAGDFTFETFPMEGTANGTEMWREDHNCMWDLNAYTYTAEGKNVVEKFQNQNNAVVLGQWGHVIDFAVAGIIEFLPQQTARATEESGRIIANGLAACEWSPRQGVNAYHSNLELLTKNCLEYLSDAPITTAVDEIGVDNNITAPVEYFNLQGIKIDENKLTSGVYIKRQGSATAKVLVK